MRTASIRCESGDTSGVGGKDNIAAEIIETGLAPSKQFDCIAVTTCRLDFQAAIC
jgi:hypothetical protein